MTLPKENLDNKTFDELLKEAITRIPVYAPEWTDHNIHDPGITFIELFAWLTEMQIYRLNRINDRSYRKFLKLLGILKPEPSRAAKVDVTFSLLPGVTQADVPKETVIAATDPVMGEDLLFETEQDLKVISTELTVLSYKEKRYLFSWDKITTDDKETEKLIKFLEKKYEIDWIKKEKIIKDYNSIKIFDTNQSLSLVRNDEKTKVTLIFGDKKDEFIANIEDNELNIYENSIYTDNTDANRNENVYYYVFRSEQPIKGDGLYLGFKDDPGNEITLAFYLLDGDLSEEEDTSELVPSGTVKWEYYAEDDWYKVEEITDETRNLTVSGKIRINIKNRMKIKNIENKSLFWLRCTVEESGYEIPPKIDRLLLNTVPAVHSIQHKDCMFSGTDIPDFHIDLKYAPVLDITLTVNINEPWSEVEDFDASKPGDRHYTVDLSSGRVTFGDGIHGKIPSKGKDNITVSYRSGGGVRGNVKPNAINRVLSELAEKVTVNNAKAASGGEDAETLEEAVQRARKEFKTITRAVTSTDYEYLAKNTPGLRVARTKALPRYHPSQDREVPGIISVIVIPESPYPKPVPSKGFLKTVYRHLDKHRLLTTEIFVLPPEYIEVSVSATVVVKPKSLPDNVKKHIETKLEEFLHPVSGGIDGKGWPFGRSVYVSEIYEIIDGVEGVDYVKPSVKLNGTTCDIDIPAEGLVFLDIKADDIVATEE